MGMIVAGVTWLFAFITGVVSFAFAPCFLERSGEGADGNADNHVAPAALSRFFQKSNWKQICFVCVAALVCAVTVYKNYARSIAPGHLFRQIAMALVLLCAMIIDGKTRRIPNLLVMIAFAVGVVFQGIVFITERSLFREYLASSVVGACGCLVLFYLLARLTKNGIGMGDVKLMTAVGWLHGLTSTLFIVLAAMLLCSVCAVFLLLGKKKNKSDSLPFGPYLFFGYIILLLLFHI